MVRWDDSPTPDTGDHLRSTRPNSLFRDVSFSSLAGTERRRSSPSPSASGLLLSPLHLGRRHLPLVSLTRIEGRGTSPSPVASGLVPSPGHLGRRCLLPVSMTGMERNLTITCNVRPCAVIPSSRPTSSPACWDHPVI